MGWGEFFGKLFGIIDKFIPGRKEQYYNALKKLEVEYDKALKERRDTDAAVIRKQMEELRKKLKFAGGDI